MKKTIIVFIIFVVALGIGIWCYNSIKKQNVNSLQAQKYTNSTNYQAEKSSTNSNANKTSVIKKETEIAIFSTKIYNKDEERQNNIGITCRTLSTKQVKPGEIFSFCDTIGKSTSAKGYQEADIYVDGKKEKGLGGGNCQVSTTLYNAVLKVPELEVLERHKHSGHVPYIQEGRDAAVSYGAYDFKFKNNSNNVIKIVMENTADNITAKIIKIE